MKAGWVAMMAAALCSLLAWWLMVGADRLGPMIVGLVVGNVMGLLVRWTFALVEYRRMQRAFGLSLPKKGRRR